MPGIDENTLLIIHGNEIKDSSKYGKTITNNNVTVNTATTKFGKGSLYFNGSNSSLNLQAYEDLKFGSSNFTVDWWEYRSRNAGSVFNISYAGVGYGFLATHSNGTLLYAASAENTWDLFNGVIAFSPSVNQWVHWAIVRNGSQWRTYKNGVKFWEGTNSKPLNTSSIAGTVIGSQALGTDFFQGYIEEFRISNVARWTDNFMPPTEQYTAHHMASHTFLGLENGKTFYARVYPQNSKKYFQSELTGQVAIAETGGGELNGFS